MSKLSQFPNMLKAVELVFADNGMFATLWYDDWEIPADELEKFAPAEEAAALLNGKPLNQFIDEDQIDRESHAPTDDALNVMCSGEESTRALLVSFVDTSAIVILDGLLCSIFDGRCSQYWTTRYGEHL